MSEELKELESNIPTEVAIASALIPWDRDDEKARYFGYRCTGFSVRETLQLIYRTKSWLSNCRHLDSDKDTFVNLESRIPEFRKELAKEYVELDFFRNFRLALEKDYRVLKASLNQQRMKVIGADGEETEMTVPMSKQDFEYLLKLRSQYTPQQLQILEAIVSGSESGFNFAKWVSENQEIVQMSRTDTVTVARRGQVEENDS